jgi:hypothetical protein
MITRIMNLKENNKIIKLDKKNNNYFHDYNNKITGSSNQISFKGSDKLVKDLFTHTTSKVGKKLGRLLEESADSIKGIFIKLKGADEIPFSHKPLIAPETYDELVALAESGNKGAEATLAIVEKLKIKDIYVSKYDDLFTSDGKFTESAAHNFADSIMLHKPSDGVDLMKNMNSHMDYKYLGNLDKDIDYLTTLKNNGHFDTYADKVFNPEHRTNLTYTDMHLSEKFPTGSFYEADRDYVLKYADTLTDNDLDILKKHPEFLKEMQIAKPEAADKLLEQHPELAKELADDNIHELGINKIGKVVGDNVHDGVENLTGKIHEFGSNIGDGLKDGFEHMTDGVHETIGNITSHFDFPDIKVPDFDFNFSETFEHIKDVLDDIWDWLT